MPNTKKFEDYKIADKFSETRFIRFEDVQQFAEVVGDKNPIHLDKEYAEASSFKGRIVHGAFLFGFISKILGVDFPGAGTIYLSQEIKFFRPVYVDSSIEINLEVAEIDEEKQRLKINTDILNADGKPCVKGQALVWYPN